MNSSLQEKGNGYDGDLLPAFDALCHEIVPVASVDELVYEKFVETLEIRI